MFLLSPAHIGKDKQTVSSVLYFCKNFFVRKRPFFLPLLYMTNIRQLFIYFITKVELFLLKNALLRYSQ